MIKLLGLRTKSYQKIGSRASWPVHTRYAASHALSYQLRRRICEPGRPSQSLGTAHQRLSGRFCLPLSSRMAGHSFQALSQLQALRGTCIGWHPTHRHIIRVKADIARAVVLCLLHGFFFCKTGTGRSPCSRALTQSEWECHARQ